MIGPATVWSEFSLPSYSELPGGVLRFDVAIIGSGFAGLSAALHLLKRRPAARVAVLDTGRVGHGASGRNTGLLGPGVGQSLGGLVKRFGAGSAQALYRASLDAVAAVARIVSDEGIECDLEMKGQLVVARSGAGSRRLAEQAALLARFGFPVEELDQEALHKRICLEPAPSRSVSRTLAALRLPFAGTLHPTRLLAGLAASVSRRGATIFENAQVLEIGKGEPAHLKLHGGEVIADRVVIATAGYTASLGLLRGRILPVRLQALSTEPLSDRALASIGWSGREGVLDSKRIFNYFRLTKDNRIVFGGGTPRYCWRGAASPGEEDRTALRRLEAELAATFPREAQLKVQTGWTGMIGYVYDGVPAIARMRDCPSVIHVAGWCGHGVALALASGDWVAGMLCGKDPDDLPWFRDDPPLVPFESLRWLAFRAAVGGMSFLDRLEQTR